MNRIAAYLKEPGIRTRLVLMIHDELVLEGPPEESAEVIPRVQNILESVYAGKYLPLLCSVEHSFKSLASRMIKIKNLATGCLAELTHAALKAGVASIPFQPTGQSPKPVEPSGAEKGNTAKEPAKAAPSKVIL